MKTILFAAIVALTFTTADAKENSQSPVSVGDFCTFWYEAPRSFLAGLKERRAFVCIKEVRGDWVHVELYYSEQIATAMSLVSEIERGTDAGLKFLASSSMTKEQFLQKVAAEPLTEKQRRTLWINIAAVEAITPISPEQNMAEQVGGGQSAIRSESK